MAIMDFKINPDHLVSCLHHRSTGEDDFFFWPLMALLIGQLRDDRKQDEKDGEKTCSKGPQVRPEPWTAAARTRPLHMGCPLYQVS